MQIKITVSTKKGHTQDTTWNIVQERPYPSLVDAHRLRWSNGGALFPQYGDTNPVGIGDAYRCTLDRKPEDAGKPTIVLRGADLGDITIRPCHREHCCTGIDVRGFGHPTTGERDWIAAQIIPSLLEAIAANRDALRAVAVEGLREHFRLKIADAHGEINRLEREAAAVMAKL